MKVRRGRWVVFLLNEWGIKSMDEWTKKHPKISGYYWIKRRNMLTQIVYLTPSMLVFEFCNRNPLSPYYDIKEWGSRLNNPDGESNNAV